MKKRILPRLDGRWRKSFTHLMFGLIVWVLPCVVSAMVCMEDDELNQVSASAGAGGATFGLVNNCPGGDCSSVWSLQTWLLAEPTVFVPVNPAIGDMVHDLKGRNFRVQLFLEGYMTMDIFSTDDSDFPAIPVAAQGIPYYHTTLYTNDNFDRGTGTNTDGKDSRMNILLAAGEFWVYDNNTISSDAFPPNWTGLTAQTVNWRPNLLTAINLLGMRIPNIYIDIGRHKSGAGANMEIGGQLSIENLALNFLNPTDTTDPYTSNRKGELQGVLMANSFGGNATLPGSAHYTNYGTSYWGMPDTENDGTSAGQMAGDFKIGDIYGDNIGGGFKPLLWDFATNSTTNTASQAYKKTFSYFNLGHISGSLRIKKIVATGFTTPSWLGATTIVGNSGIYLGGPSASPASFGEIAVDGIRVYEMKAIFPGSHYQDIYSVTNDGSAAGAENTAYFARPYVRTCFAGPYNRVAQGPITRSNPMGGCEGQSGQPAARKFW